MEIVEEEIILSFFSIIFFKWRETSKKINEIKKINTKRKF